jgi:hypothetical protein
MTNSFISSENLTWVYHPESRMWKVDDDTFRHYRAMNFPTPHCRTPEDYRKAADIIEQAHPKHMVRKRVVAGDAWWIGADNGNFLQFPFENDVDEIRNELAEFEDDLEVAATITKHDLKAIEDLRDNGIYEVSIDGGDTWFPSTVKE